MTLRYQQPDDLPLPSADQLVEIIIRAAGAADPDGIAAALRLLTHIDPRRAAWTYDALILGILLADHPDTATSGAHTAKSGTLSRHGGHP